MENKLLSSLVKQVGSVIGWLGGGLVGITAILSALGYLVMRSHQNLLGITGFVPIPPERWSIEGSRFLYNSLLYLLGTFFSFGWVFFLLLASILLSILMANWAVTLRRITKHSLTKALILMLSFIGISTALYLFVQSENVSHLLSEPLLYDDTLPIYNDAPAVRSNAAGIRQLRVKYALLESILLFLVVWLKLLKQMLNEEKTLNASPEKRAISSSWFTHWYKLLCVLVLFLFLLLPMNYGKMARSNHFFKVLLFRSSDEPVQTQAAYEGWLLHKDGDEIVLFNRTAATQQIHILKRGNFADIQTIAFGNIFAE